MTKLETIIEEFIHPLGLAYETTQGGAARRPSPDEVANYQQHLIAGIREVDWLVKIAVLGYFTQFIVMGWLVYLSNDNRLLAGFLGIEGVGTGALGAFLLRLWRERVAMVFLAMSVPSLAPEELGSFVASIGYLLFVKKGDRSIDALVTTTGAQASRRASRRDSGK